MKVFKKSAILLLLLVLMFFFAYAQEEQGLVTLKKKIGVTEQEWNRLPEDTKEGLKHLNGSRLEEIKKEIDNINKAIAKEGALWNAGYNPIILLNDRETKKLARTNLNENFIEQMIRNMAGLKDSNKEEWENIPGENRKLIESINKNRAIVSKIGELGFLTNPVAITSAMTKTAPPAATASIEIPESFSWTNYQGSNYLTPVKNQLNCGSCWAFATLGSLEGVIRAYYNNPHLNINLSEQDLVSCSSAGDCGWGCADKAAKFIKNNGITTEECFPYTASNSPCSRCSDWLQNKWSIAGYNDVPLNEEAIKKALITKGPLITYITVYSDFMAYQGGIYSHVTGKRVGLGHLIVLVGYGSYDGKTYWICKNSWGTAWGEAGYFKIFAGECGIDSICIYSLDTPIPPTNLNGVCSDSDKDGYCVWGIRTKPNDCQTAVI